MNVLAMLERRADHQVTEFDPTLPGTILPPEQPWREQEILPADPILSCEEAD